MTPIRRPDAPRHYMTIEEVDGRVRATVGDVCVASSTHVLRLTEVGGSKTFEPVFYFPRADVTPAVLVPQEKRTHCPLKGDACYFDLRVDAALVKDGAWSYEKVLDFDARLVQLENAIAFDRRSVRVDLPMCRPAMRRPAKGSAA